MSYDEFYEEDEKVVIDPKFDPDVEAFKNILNDYKVRKWLWELLEYCKIFESISYSDSHHIAIASGRKDIGLWVLSKIFEANPEAFTLMQKEHLKRMEEMKNG